MNSTYAKSRDEGENKPHVDNRLQNRELTAQQKRPIQQRTNNKARRICCQECSLKSGLYMMLGYC